MEIGLAPRVVAPGDEQHQGERQRLGAPDGETSRNIEHGKTPLFWPIVEREVRHLINGRRWKAVFGPYLLLGFPPGKRPVAGAVILRSSCCGEKPGTSAAVTRGERGNEGREAAKVFMAGRRLLNVILMRVLKRRAGTLYVGIRHFFLIPGVRRRDVDKGRT
jgi:hypothetical protein